MIKHLISITLALIISFSITGCFLLSKRGLEGKSSQKEIEGCQKENVSAPDWTCTPIVEGFYSAVGVVMESSLGMDHTRKIALTEGRSKLAKEIKSQVKSKVQNFVLETEIGKADTAANINMDVSREIANVDLSTSIGIKTWSSPSKNLYMLVTLDENEVNNVAKAAVINSLKKNATLFEQFESGNYIKDLEKEFPTAVKKKLK
ncbi:LPP20 family lipoprotein [Sulfurimonas sp. CS5]|jgi:hypothetical protein|uniref:LPP20 family lipoprotein n=1 Tax=Sulfurimonas sp. CS5 TaxID=3391145 RepID=UPI0039ECDE1D